MKNEKRLIDAKDWDSFYADIGDSRNMMDSYDRGYTDALDRVDDWMDAQPTVDAVEVVRCKDCKFAESYERTDGETGYYCKFGGNSFTYGQNWDRQFNPVREANDFCSRGERRDNE